MSDVVTGDAVVLDLRLARFPARVLALLIDIGLIALLLAFFGAAADRLFSGTDAALSATIGLVAVVGLLVGVPVGVETLTRGRSLGKLALGLRVVRDDGGPVRFRQCLTRALFGVVEIWLTTGVVALFASLLSERGKRLGDVFAGTVVIRERMPVQGGQVAHMPPPLIPWASTADVDRVPDALLFRARQLVARIDDLAPQVRFTMAADLAAEVAAYVSPPSPRGTPPDAYLMAVIVERRRRDQWRAERNAAARAASTEVTNRPPPQPAARPAPTAPPSTQQPATQPPTRTEPTDPARPQNGGFAPPG